MSRPRVGLLTLLTAAIVMALSALPATSSQAAPSPYGDAPAWAFRSVTFAPTSTSAYSTSDFQSSVQEAKADGANYITLVMPYFQTTLTSSDPAPGSSNSDVTPTLQSLQYGIAYVHSLGLKAAVKVHFEDDQGIWRAHLDPSDRDTWFAAADQIEVSLAQLRPDMMIIGTEMADLASNRHDTSNGAYWDTMISQLRAASPSTVLTYDAGSEASAVTFWPALDYVAFSVYNDLAVTCDATVPELVTALGPSVAAHVALAKKYGKRLLLGEVGYSSASCDHQYPWQYRGGETPDYTEQANDYSALLTAYDHQARVAGLSWWNWGTPSTYGSSGPATSDFTPQDKPAEQVMQAFFTGMAPAPITMVLTPVAQAVAGTTIPFDDSVTAPQGASNAIVDLEVYSGTTRVAQQFTTGQDLSAGVATSFTLPWTPASAGSYTVKLGLFTANWASTLAWNDDAMDVTVTSQPTPPTGIDRSLQER